MRNSGMIQMHFISLSWLTMAAETPGLEVRSRLVNIDRRAIEERRMMTRLTSDRRQS